MTIRSFWTILVKLLGVYVILQALIAIPSMLLNLSSAISMISMEANNGRVAGGGIFVYFAYLILIIGIYGLILWACLAKTDWIIDKLKLDKGFAEDRFEISMHRSSILKIVIILIGGLTLMDSVPALCRYIYSCLQQSTVYFGFKRNPDSVYLLLNLVRTIIGFFMVTSSRLIVNFIEAKRRKVTVGDIADTD